jgi:hypothetical protein
MHIFEADTRLSACRAGICPYCHQLYPTVRLGKVLAVMFLPGAVFGALML